MKRFIDTFKFLYFYSIPPSMTMGAMLELERKQESQSYPQAITKGLVNGGVASIFFPLTIYKIFYPTKV